MNEREFREKYFTPPQTAGDMLRAAWTAGYENPYMGYPLTDWEMGDYRGDLRRQFLNGQSKREEDREKDRGEEKGVEKDEYVVYIADVPCQEFDEYVFPVDDNNRPPGWTSGAGLEGLFNFIEPILDSLDEGLEIKLRVEKKSRAEMDDVDSAFD